MRIVAGLVAAALVLFSSSTPARAVAVEFDAWLVWEDSVGSFNTLPIPITQVTLPDGTTIGTVENWSWTCGALCADDGFRVTDLDLTLDPDPFMNFGASVLDFGAASSFQFVFTQAITATAAPGVATSSLQGSTTNGGSGAGLVSITPLAPPVGISQDGDGVEPNEIMVYSLSTDGGTSWQNVGIDLGPAYSNPSQTSATYGTYSGGPINGPAGSGSYDAMRVDVNFQLSGGSDAFSFNGTATIVPEPTTASLMALGLFGLAWRSRRRKL
jgi:PEP-CTERM motif